MTLAQTLGLTRSNPDYYALELGNHVLGGAFYATRLYRDLREETGLVYTVESTFKVGVTRSLYGVTFGCDPGEYVAKARAIVVRDLRQMQTDARDAGGAPAGKGAAPSGDTSVAIERRPDRPEVYLSLHPSSAPRRAYPRRPQVCRSHAEQVRAAYDAWLRPGDLVQVIEGPPLK